MANRERGEVAVKTLDGVEYTLAPSHNALCELQTALGKKPDAVVEMAVDGDPFAMRGVIWCLLQKFHKSEVPDFEAAGEWIDRVGGHLGAMNALTQATKANLELHGISGTPENPLVAQVGTGESSLSVLAASA